MDSSIQSAEKNSLQRVGEMMIECMSRIEYELEEYENKE
jgi:hypothetical protein